MKKNIFTLFLFAAILFITISNSLFSIAIAANKKTVNKDSSKVSSNNTANKLNQLLNRYKTYQADFQQTVFDEKDQVIQRSQGRMFLMRPFKFRWETTDPVRQVIITDGKELWTYDQDLAQATKQKFTTQNAGDPAALLSGKSANLAKRFFIKKLALPPPLTTMSLREAKARVQSSPISAPSKSTPTSPTSKPTAVSAQPGGEITFELTPKSQKSAFKSIQMTFQQKQLTNMRVVNNLGQTSDFHFSKIKLNAPLKSELFNFKAPQGVEVLKQ